MKVTIVESCDITDDIKRAELAVTNTATLELRKTLDKAIKSSVKLNAKLRTTKRYTKQYAALERKYWQSMVTASILQNALVPSIATDLRENPDYRAYAHRNGISLDTVKMLG